MLHKQSLIMPATKVASVYWLPASLLVVGLVGWQVWQHRKNASQHKKLVQHIEALQNQLKTSTDSGHSTQEANPASSATEQQTTESCVQQPQNGSMKSALFEYVINENIALRKFA